MKKFSSLVLSFSLIFFPTVVMAKSPVEELEIVEEYELLNQVQDALDEVSWMTDKSSKNTEDSIQWDELPNSIYVEKAKATSLGERIIEKIRLKNQLTSNVVQSIDLTKQLKSDRKEIQKQLKRIRSSDVSFTEEELIEVARLSKQMVTHVRESEYIAGSIGREMIRTAQLIKNKSIFAAMINVETIVSLQEERLNLLMTVNADMQELLDVMQKVK